LDTGDVFIHGALLGDGGTCASLPVVYAAVGRRLGYPIRLVSTRRHLFARWDEPDGERFNIEATNAGLSCHPDDYYRTGRYPVTPAQEAETTFLVSLKPKQELADFLAQRGYCWHDLRRYREAAESFIWASMLDPQHKLHGGCAVEVLQEWGEKIKADLPPRIPNITVRLPPQRRFPTVPPSVEYEFVRWEILEAFLQDPSHAHWLEVLRNGPPPGQPPPRIPRSIILELPR
jgi:hypothetical protein